MVYQSLDLVGTVHIHDVQGEYLYVKGCHGPIVLPNHEKLNFITRDVL